MSRDSVSGGETDVILRILQCLFVNIAVMVMWTSHASAVDWSLKLGASQSLTVNDNINLAAIARDTAVQTISQFNFDLLGKSKSYEIEFAPSINVEKTFFGETTNEWAYQPAARLDFRKMGKVSTVDVFASFARRDASSNQLLRDILTTNEGEQLIYSTGALTTDKINGQNTVEWSNVASVVDYTIPSDDLVPSVDLNSTITWRRQFSQLVGADFSGGIEYYQPKSEAISDAWGYRSSIGAHVRLTKRLTVNGNAGVVLWNPVGAQPIIGPRLSVSADDSFKDTNFAASAVLDLSPGTDGKIINTFSTQITVAHKVNDLLSLGLTGQYSMDWSSGSGTSRVLIISPSLNYQLSQNWKSSMSYQFVQSDDSGTAAYSNAVTLSLSYGGVVLP